MSVSGTGGRRSTYLRRKRYVGHADLERRLRRVLDDGRAVFLGEREDAEDLPDAGGAVVLRGCACRRR